MREVVGERAVIACVSNHDQPSLKQRCILLGADDYLEKPFGKKDVERLWLLWTAKNRAACIASIPECPISPLSLAVDGALEGMARVALEG